MTAQTSFKSANQLLREGKLDAAVAAYREAIAVNPGFSHAHHNLGEALVKAGRVDEAVAAYRRAVELNPQAVWSLFKLGELLRGQERFEEAVGFLRGAVELKSDVAEFNLGLGAALVRLGSALEEAEACLRRAVELNPFLAEAFYFLGVAASGRGQWSEAVEFYGRGLDVNPSGVECGLGLAEALGKLGRWSEAVERYGEMELASGESGEVCFGLGQALGQLGRWEEGVVEYRRAVALGFAGAEVRHHLGYALGQLGRWEEGVVEYRLVVEVNPKSAPVRHQLGYGLMQLGRWGEAAVELRRSVELYPGSAVVWQQLGDVLRELGEDEEAEIELWKAVDLHPGAAVIWQQLGNALRGLGKNEEAVEAYQNAIAQKPDFYQAHHNLGEALQKLGHSPEAVEQYRQVSQELKAASFSFDSCLKLIQRDPDNLQNYYKALEIKPESHDLYYKLGGVFDKKGRPDLALAFYQVAIQIEPNNAQYYLKMGNIFASENNFNLAVKFYRKSLAIDSRLEIAQRRLDDVLHRQELSSGSKQLSADGFPTQKQYKSGKNQNVFQEESLPKHSQHGFKNRRKKITFATIVLNESEFIENNLKQHYELCDDWIIVEGACRGYPANRVTKDGLSTDETARIIRNFPDSENKIRFIQHGWTKATGEDAKSEMRNRYADLTEDELLVVIDADEFYRRDDLRKILATLEQKNYSCYRLPQIHLWKGTNKIIVGGYWDIGHNRIYSWQSGLRYRSNHNHPETELGKLWHEVGEYIRSPRKLVKRDGGYIHPSPCCFHFGFAKSETNMRDKTDYYIGRGEDVTRPKTTTCREAWFTNTIPEGCKLLPWKGRLPEVFCTS